MNKSKIEWCDHTFNIITGCLHGCDYCYARTMTRRFTGNERMNMIETDKYRKEGELFVLDEPFLDETGHQVMYPFGFQPTLHKYRAYLLDKLKMGTNVFVGAMADVFGEWVPKDWIKYTFDICRKHQQHNYLFLTKNPQRYVDVHLPMDDNIFYGTTITREEDVYKSGYLPAHGNTFLSIEPMLEDLHPSQHETFLRDVDWVIIGAETGRRKDKVVPKMEWIRKIVVECDYATIPVFMKDSLIPVVGEENMRRDFPKKLTEKRLSNMVKEHRTDNCMRCGVEKLKSNMVTLTARTKRSGKTVAFGFMCKDCFCTWLTEHDIELPDLEGLRNGEEKKL